MRCSHCGSSNFDEDRARGDLVCLECGMVVSENAISTEVEFVETSGGQSAAVCRFVSDESQALNYKESKQITENKARRRIDSICGQLRLGNDIATSGFRYYQSALFRGLTRGRAALLIAAGCVYLAARQLRVNLMLLDLSDAVGINVYVLGRVYTDLKRRLHLAIPEMDPCIYIERFANQLEFGEKTSMVATTAMRLLQRMKKDWIATGRRPSGLAAAALLVAARIHEFNRTEGDVARIARISQYTARKRLKEFGRTPTSALSIEAFFSVDYAEEQDPPAFTTSIKQNEKAETLSDEALDRIAVEIAELERRIDDEIRKLAGKCTIRTINNHVSNIDVGTSKGIHHLLAPPSEVNPSSTSITDSNNPDKRSELSGTANECSDPCAETTNCLKNTNNSNAREILRDVLDGLVEPEILESCVEDLHILTQHSGSKMCELLTEAERIRNLAESNDDNKFLDENDDSKPSEFIENITGKDSRNPKLPAFLPSANSVKTETNVIEEDGTLCLDDIDDEEIDREYLLQPREVMLKAAIWFKANADHLEKCRRRKYAKQQQQQQQEQEGKSAKKRKTSNRRRTNVPGSSTSQSYFGPGSNEPDTKPLSRKINYEALEAIVGLSSVAGNSNLNDPKSIEITSMSTRSGTDVDESRELRPGPLLAATLSEEAIFKSPSIPQKDPTKSSIPEVTDTNVETEEDFEEDEDNDLSAIQNGTDSMNNYLPNYSQDDDDDVEWSNGNDLW